jgi:hypothetical protein
LHAVAHAVAHARVAVNGQRCAIANRHRQLPSVVMTGLDVYLRRAA